MSHGDPMADLAALVARARANPAPLSDFAARFLSDIERRTRPATPRQMATLAGIVDRVDVADLSRTLVARVGDLARALVGAEPTGHDGDTLRFRAHGSLAVVQRGPERGAFFDHEAGVGGGPLDLIAHLRRTSLPEAVDWARAWCGAAEAVRVPPTAQAAPAASERPRGAHPPATLDLARTLWREALAVDAPGSVVPAYLAARGVALEPGAPIRFHPRAWRNARFGPPGPAMIALMSAPLTGEPCGVHVTYLRPDGGGKATGERVKVMLGRAGVVRLVPDAEVTAGLGLAEGIETALSVMSRFGWRPVWAATSAGAIARFPVLAGIEALTVFADEDPAGRAAARECCTRWAETGREARICTPPAGDFNDLHRERAA